MNNKSFVRARRLRETKELRALYGIDFPKASRFIWPVFICEGKDIKRPIKSLPGQFYYSIDKMITAVERVILSGVNSILLFGVIDNTKKNSKADYSYNEKGLVQNGIKALRKEFPNLTIIADTGLSGYTDHGHAGIINKKGEIDNDQTLEVLKKIVLTQACSGASIIAPSGMMDGQVASLRSTLDNAGYLKTLIMSYTAKFHSNMFGPFPYAVQTPRTSDPKTQTYLAPPNDTKQAIREAKIDIDEGADILIIKPAIFYLDIINRINRISPIPVAAYNVSGEYLMIHSLAQTGYGDVHKLARESLLSIFRSGADIIISYWANQYNDLIKEI